jgi:hypothetical protein
MSSFEIVDVLVKSKSPEGEDTTSIVQATINTDQIVGYTRQHVPDVGSCIFADMSNGQTYVIVEPKKEDTDQLADF